MPRSPNSVNMSQKTHTDIRVCSAKETLHKKHLNKEIQNIELSITVLHVLQWQALLTNIHIITMAT